MTAPRVGTVPAGHPGSRGIHGGGTGAVRSGLWLHVRARQAPWVALAMLLLVLVQALALRRLGGEFDIPAAVQAFGPTLAVLVAAVPLVAHDGEVSRAAARHVQRWAVLVGGVLLLMYAVATAASGAVAWPVMIRNLLGTAAALMLSVVVVGVGRAWVPVALYVAAVVLLAHPRGIDAAWAWPTASSGNTGAFVTVGILMMLAAVARQGIRSRREQEHAG